MSATLETKRQPRGLAELWLLFAASILFLAFRTFLFQPFNIRSTSSNAWWGCRATAFR